MASAKVPVTFTPVDARKVEAALARIQSQAKGVNFGRGAESINKLSRPLGKITGQATEFQKSLEASNARVLAFGASVAVINKLSEAFGALVSNTIKVEATFAKINTILGGTRKEIQQFGDGIFKVAQQTGTSFDEVAEGALELARQGLSVEQTLSRVETSLKLVRVAGIDSQQAVAGLTAAIKGFEGAGLTVAQIADKLAEVDTKFAVSTEDLINGLERASASARVAGVSFDELLAVVTTVQERTQRGGAVIGNAFKTIFARLSRTDTLQTLNQLGIEVLDAQGNVRGAIPLFQELAVELDRLGLQSVKAGDIIQKVAGVRQRDILISLVEDLNSGQSQFAKALGVSATAAGALDAKNAKLNDTLEALINNLTVGGQKLASVLGEIGFTDAAKDILKTLSSVVSGITDILQGESAGAKFAQGLLKGVGSVLTGPGLALISAIFIKLFIDLAKFGKDSIKQILGINRAAQQQAALQQSVLQTLLQNENIQREILALEGNKVAQEQLLLRIYNQQAAALARVQKAAATVTPGLFGAGLRGGTKGVAPKGRASGGYVAAEARDVSRGVGGAPASSKVVSIPNFAFGGGKRGTMVANSSEYYVPNYAGGGDAIFNRDMVRSMGLPSGARKINAAGGYIPNFANRNVGNYGFLIPEMGANRPLKPLDVSIAGKKVTLTGARARGIQPGEAKTVSDPIENRIRKSVIDSSTKYANELQPLGRTVSRADIETGFGTIAGAKGALQAAIGSAFEVGITTALDYKAAIREKGGDFDIRGGANLPRIRKLFGMPASMSIADLKVSDSVGNVESYYSKVMKEIGAGAFTNREKRANARSIALGQLRKKYPQFYTTKGVLKTRGISTADKRRMEDLEARTTSKVLSSRFGNAASGYIPNFVGGALEQAVAREQSAGLPISQIRINQSGKLRNSQNPQGLAVTNTRDEPTGAIPNFAQYPIGVGTRFAPGGGRQRDNIESLSQSAGKASSALDNSITKIFALQLATSGLTSAFTEQDDVFNRLGTELNGFINTLLTLQLVGASPKIPGLGKGAKGGAGMLAGLAVGASRLTASFGKFIPYVGTGILLFQGFNGILKTITGKGIFEKLGFSAEKAADKLNEVANAGKPGSDIGGAKSRVQELKERLSEIETSLGAINLPGRKRTVEDIERELAERREFARGLPGGEERSKAFGEVRNLERERERAISKGNIDIQKSNELEKEKARLLEEQTKIQEELNKLQKKGVEVGEAATRLALAFSRRQNQLEVESVRRAGARAGIERRPMGSVERAAFSIQGERDAAAEKVKVARLNIRRNLVEQIKLQDSVTDIQKDQLDIILSQAHEYGSIEQLSKAINTIEGLTLNNFGEMVRQANLQNTQLDDTVKKDQEILNLRKQQAIEAAKANIGLAKYSSETQKKLIDQAEDLPYVLAQNIEQSMANTFDKLATGAYDSIGDAFLNIALDFGRELQKQIMQRAAANITSSLFGKGTAGGGFLGGLSKAITGFNSGGLVSGGSGVRDDVPAKLTGGEYVIRKSAVQKYGLQFLENLNSGAIQGMQAGGFFVPGTRGQGAITGKENLLAFAQQEGTSGLTDQMRAYGASGAAINLEQQSSRLTAFGRMRDSPARRALKEAQQQAFGLYVARIEEEERIKQEVEAAKKARSQQLMSSIVGSFVSAAGAGLGTYFQNPGTTDSGLEAGATDLVPSSAGGYTPGGQFNSNFSNPLEAANGGQMSGRTNALLMGGEYVVSPQAASMIGRSALDDINMMRFQNGGAVGNVTSSSGGNMSGEGADVGEVNITINMAKGDASVTADSNGNTDPTKTKEFARKVKEVVVNVIAEEKRVSGSLFTRAK